MFGRQSRALENVSAADHYPIGSVVGCSGRIPTATCLKLLVLTNFIGTGHSHARRVRHVHRNSSVGASKRRSTTTQPSRAPQRGLPRSDAFELQLWAGAHAQSSGHPPTTRPGRPGSEELVQAGRALSRLSGPAGETETLQCGLPIVAAILQLVRKAGRGSCTYGGVSFGTVSGLHSNH